MGFQTQPHTIQWKMHFSSSPEKVYEALATNAGRAMYWAESAQEVDGYIEFNIYGYPPFKGKILSAKPSHMFSLEYVGTNVTFTLDQDDQGGTDLTMHAENVEESLRFEMIPGWISVLMAMKAAVDFGVDLRNHDPKRCWNTGYADN